MSTNVKWYLSTMQGAPQLTNVWGAMTAVLDAVLVNGFNEKTVDSLVSVDGVATLNINLGHRFIPDQIISISGANESDYNGEFRVTNITANSLSFAISNSAPSVATGTINVKTAPLGWDLVFSSTNKRAYRSKNVLSNKPFLRVDDGCDPVWNTTYAKYAKVTMAENMTDIDTFIGARAPYDSSNPTKNEIGTGTGNNAYGGWYKWYYARRTEDNWEDANVPETFNRHWVIVGDDRGFYLFNELGLFGTRARSGRCFTDFISYKQDDQFNTLLVADDLYSYPNQNVYRSRGDMNYFHQSLNYSGKILMRDHLGVGGNQRVSFMGLNTRNDIVYSGEVDGIPYVNPCGYAILLQSILLLQENNKGIRGELPGLMWIHNGAGAGDLSIIDDVVGYPGRKFLVVAISDSVSAPSTGRMAIDITGPWW